MAYQHSRERHQPGKYHVFNRARDGLALFRDDDDREAFSDMLVRHLSVLPTLDGRGQPYACLRDEVSMFARNLLTTHFHLGLVQKQPGGMEDLLHRVLAPYVRRYNRKYGTTGPLFSGEFRARPIGGRNNFKWRVAYINDNHKRLGLDYKFSTHRYYLDPESAPSWIAVKPALKVFGGVDAYLDYLADRRIRNQLDSELRG